ncbi:MAG: peptidylprolyl isomerase, partial [Oscillospiraceae bacterium]|nr:peptidylprolyl isomerase [Oscillospiraceae bacterium]
MKRLLVIFLLLTFLVGCSTGTTEPTTESTTAGTEETTETVATVTLPAMEILGNPGYGNNDVLALNHFTVTEAAPNDSDMTTVIAVAGENQDPIYENRHLQVAYWTEYLNFMGTYGSYASMMGMDTTQPLWAQEIDAGKTWEQYFLEFAVQGLARNYALAKYAEAQGITLSAEDQANLDDILLPEGSFAEEYTSQGYTDADSYIQYYFGNGTDALSYQEYYTTYLLAATCYQQKQAELTVSLSEEDVLAYYAENKETYENQGKIQANNINVRHILIQPEGEQDTWTDESWAAAEAQAQALYDQWLLDPSEDAFAALATDNTMDPGSAETGGLYEEVAPGDMVAEFNDWCFDAERQIGDSGIVK